MSYNNISLLLISFSYTYHLSPLPNIDRRTLMAPNWKAIAGRIGGKYIAALASRIAEPQHNTKQQPHSTVAEMAQQMLREENLSDEESGFVFEMIGLAEDGHQMSPRQSDRFNALLWR
jgi:hypothetical protein